MYATSSMAGTSDTICAAAPQSGGTLVYARRAQTQELNPLQIRNGNGDIFAINQTLQGLVRSDPQGGFDIQPAIAESWDVSSDGLTYTFHIRKGIKFSDGTPVTADDVKFSLDRFADPKLNQVLSVAAVGYKASEVVDPQTIKVQLSTPVAGFLYNISIFPAYIVPKKLVEAQGEKFWDAPVGTGPFKIKELAHGSYIAFEANRNYWETGKPYLDEVRFNFAADDNSRILQLKSGGAHMADGVPYSLASSLQSDSALVLQTDSVPLFAGLWLNHQKEILQDNAVRQAMQYALDRNTINAAIYGGFGTIPNSVLPHLKFDAAADKVAPYAYDLDKAKELMAKSKHPEGFSITLQYPAGFEDYKQLGLYLKQAWKKIGIDLELVEQDQATVSDRYYQGDYDLTFPYAQFTSDVVIPDEYAYLLNDPSNGLNGFFSWWHDDAVWQTVQKFGTSTDEKERAELWPQIQQQMLDISPVINIMNLPFISAHAQNVCGAKVDALGSDHLENVWLAPQQ
ncbi:peptide/nickel transport system substrate-binding protein [Pararhizobium capsulatum DSM 1112]|uniref:Peptide/nickel transport system substrate-binding protein n=1 Tax=Pararhizobium capsulatum DSM 1112 TaxID=1121113 RepID=A0ABU0C0E5_9HYPH|nr:ABC transporter substrate-binding protein [Pararhizobium capsulatum]MDQ0323424.1 peptide/nickel transport system substrate-binding protein [Pararhizobium capsulatum DSM 1112]